MGGGSSKKKAKKISTEEKVSVAADVGKDESKTHSQPEEKESKQEQQQVKQLRRHVVIIMGPPGAGKGTHAKRIVSDFRIAHLSTGDMLRGYLPLGIARHDVTLQCHLLKTDLITFYNLTKHLNMLHAGAVAAGTEIGKRAKAVMDAGGLVGDDIVIGIIAERITQVCCKL